MILDEFIAFLIEIRQKHGVGDKVVRVRNIHAEGTEELNSADVMILTTREYVTDNGDEYIVIG